MRRRVTTDGLGQRRADLALGDLVDLPLIRHPHLPFVRRVWELRDEVTPYDAAYIALAETLGIPFVTADRGLATASGIRCAIEVLGKS